MNTNLKSYASALALLGSLGMLAPGEAAAVPVPSAACPDQKPYVVGEEGRQSVVLSAFVDDSPTNEYGFKVCNISGTPGVEQPEHRLRDWELPYDPLAGITNITAPEGWNWSLETIGDITDPNNTGWGGTVTWTNPLDPFFDPRYLSLTQVIHFYTCEGVSECYGASGSAIPAGGERSGFGFQSPFGVTNSPYQASWIEFLPRSGDPDFPNRPGAPDSPGLLPLEVPEPNGLALFGLALAALVTGRARRKKTDPA